MSTAPDTRRQAYNPGFQHQLRQVCREQPGRLGVLYHNSQDIGLFAPIPVASPLRGSPASSRRISSSSVTMVRTSVGDLDRGILTTDSCPLWLKLSRNLSRVCVIALVAVPGKNSDFSYCGWLPFAKQHCASLQ